MMSHAIVTAAFCTLSRYNLLEQAVASLISSKGFDFNVCEILVVDNTPEGSRQPLDNLDGVRVIFCSELGLSSSRNLAIKETHTALIAFLDDDVLVDDGWLTSLQAVSDAHHDAIIFGGKTAPRFEREGKPKWYYDHLSTYLSCIDWGREERPIRAGEWLVGANIAFRREVFEEFGLFDTALGRRGHRTLLGNEEIALLRAVGHARSYYVPDMSVQHRIDQSRMELGWFRRRVVWQAISDLLAGEIYLSDEDVASRFKTHILNCPAEFRTLRSLSYEPPGPMECQSQLEALYAYTIMLANGLA